MATGLLLRRLNVLTMANRRIGVVRNNLAKMSSATTANDQVLIERRQNKGVITLNRPKALNSLNLDMVRQIYPQVKAWDEDPEMSMILIKGAGEKAFCAGGDVVAIVRDKVYGATFFKEEYILNNAIGTLQIPWVALIDGVTMGGGVGLSVHGHYRVATERTVFAMPETAIGLFPDVGGGYFLSRLGGKLGIFLAVTGYRLKGRDVQRAGIATHFVESGSLGKLEDDLVNLDNPAPEEIDDVIRQYHKACDLERDKPFVLESQMDNINRLFSGDTMEEIFHALEADGSDWATKQLDIMKKVSPTSMKVTLKQLQRGAAMTLQDNLQMEYRAGERFLLDKDFSEGVRAVLIDKDHKPKWDPPTIFETDDAHVDTYFDPLPEDRELKL